MITGVNTVYLKEASTTEASFLSNILKFDIYIILMVQMKVCIGITTQDGPGVRVKEVIMDMNKLTLMIADAKERVKSLSLEVRFKSLMYAFIIMKGNTEILKLGDNVSDIFSMLYDIDPGLGRTIFTENKEYASLRIMLGMSAEAITQELTKFSSELLRFTEACKEVE